MGTNFYRVVSLEEMMDRKNRLIEKVKSLELTPANIEREFSFPIKDSWKTINPWDEFIDGTCIHLGKRSGGWKFLWNFHHGKYYKNKEELFSFIRSGRVVDEYGEELEPDNFIEMALNWNTGWDNQTYYEKNPSIFFGDKFNDTYIDGLRVSISTEFS